MEDKHRVEILDIVKEDIVHTLQTIFEEIDIAGIDIGNLPRSQESAVDFIQDFYEDYDEASRWISHHI